MDLLTLGFFNLRERERRGGEEAETTVPGVGVRRRWERSGPGRPARRFGPMLCGGDGRQNVLCCFLVVVVYFFFDLAEGLEAVPRRHSHRGGDSGW